MVASLLIAAALAATNAPAAFVADTNGVPPRIVTTWNQAQRELRRTAAQQADGALDAAAAARRRSAVARAFSRVCREKGLSETETAWWRDKLMER